MSLALPKFSAFSRTTTEPAAPAPRAVWKQRIAALLGVVLWTGVALALVTHRPGDPGFTTSGDGGPVQNLLGRPGAWVSVGLRPRATSGGRRSGGAAPVGRCAAGARRPSVAAA